MTEPTSRVRRNNASRRRTEDADRHTARRPRCVSLQLHLLISPPPRIAKPPRHIPPKPPRPPASNELRKRPLVRLTALSRQPRLPILRPQPYRPHLLPIQR